MIGNKRWPEPERDRNRLPFAVQNMRYSPLLVSKGIHRILGILLFVLGDL